MRIITSWWRGYESDTAPKTHRPVTCDLCGKSIGTYVPKNWPKIEVICPECERE